MSLGALLTVIGVILAVYALARSSQRKSMGIFVPFRPILSGIALSAGLLIALEVLTQWNVESPTAKFILGLTAFLIPIGVTVWAVASWHRAKLNAKNEPQFREFLLSCLRDDVFDEAVRILTKNKDNLAYVLTGDTADLVFDRQFIEAMVKSRSWLHLELLANKNLLDTLPRHYRAVDQTFREYLASEDSPLRTSALLGEGGDETLLLTNNDEELINRTLRNPNWYHRCRVGYPLVLSACEAIESESLNEAYNCADARYGALQGIAPRSRCPVFLAIKTISHALKDSITKGCGTEEDTHRDAANLWDIFKVIQSHSKYCKETWEEPVRCGDYPTPFGFLLAEILSDYYSICNDAYNTSDCGEKNLPPDTLAPVIRMWAFCVMRLADDKEHISPRFRNTHVSSFLELILQLRHYEINAKTHQETKKAWTQIFVDQTKDVIMDSQSCLSTILNGMDPCKDHIRQNRGWLTKELRLNL